MDKKLLLKSALNLYETAKFSRLLKRNEQLRDKHLGQKAFLFATGTSILDLDLSKFNGEVTIGCNDIVEHPSFHSFDLKYYTVGVPYRFFREVGPRFTHNDHHKYFLKIDETLKNKDTIHFYHASIKRYLKKRNLLSNKECYYSLGKPTFSNEDEISFEITKPNQFYNGGLRKMIALAIFMGCKELYLYGCGYTYSPVQAWHFHNCLTMKKDPRYLSDIQLQEKIRAFYKFHPESVYGRMKTRILNRPDNTFLVDFFYHRPTVIESENDFYLKHRLIRKYADLNDVRIFNVTPKGYDSPVYEKYIESEK